MDRVLVARLVAVAEGIVDPAAAARSARLLAEADARRASPPTTPTVALVGGTGSGKSSLLNALAGSVISETGLVRPTTESPMAWVPADLDGATGRLLDDLGILARVASPPSPGWVVLDLPDTDSVRSSNALVAEWVVPRVDVVVWVVDPVKYHDARTAAMLAELRPGLAGVVVVLNKIDALGSPDVGRVRDAVTSFVADLGGTPQVLAAAGDPPGSAPVGIDRVRTAIDRAVAEKAFDPVDHLLAEAVHQVRESAPRWPDGLRGWQELADPVHRRLGQVVDAAEGAAAVAALGRAEAARAAGGAAGVALHRVLHGPPEVARASALDDLEDLLDGWRDAPKVVALRSSLERALLGVGVSESVGPALESAWETAVADAVEPMTVAHGRWWPVSRGLGWLGPLAVLAGPGMLIGGVEGGLAVTIAGLVLSILVALVSLRGGSTAGRATWEAFTNDAVAGAERRIDEVVGRPYRAAAEPLLAFREALTHCGGDPYT